MFVTSAYAQTNAVATGTADNMLFQLMPIALILVVFYLFVFRPMDKQKKAQEALLKDIKKGDEVVTASGLIGKISKIEDTEVTLELADGVKVRVLRSTISGLYGASSPAKTK
jgi:preprotein translocase subunit YajC